MAPNGCRSVLLCLALGALSAPLQAQGRPVRRPPPLPAVPAADGPLDLRIVYPLEGALVTARDSSFFFGSTGSGRATLTIDGVQVPVAPNGAFLAYIGLPSDTLPTFRFVARLGADSAVRQLRVRLPAAVVRPDSGPWLDRASMRPSGVQWAEPGERIRVSVTASPNATVLVLLPGGGAAQLVPDTALRIESGPFDRAVSLAPARREMRYVGSFAALPLGPQMFTVTTPMIPRIPYDDSARGATVVVQVPGGEARAPLPLRLGVMTPDDHPVVVLDDDTARTGATDGAVTGMPLPDGTYHWFFANGTPAEVTGRNGSNLRVRLSSTLSAWVDLSAVAAVLPPGTPPPRAVAALVRLFAQPGLVTARVRLSARVPYRVDEDGNRLTLRLYGTRMDMDWVQYGSTDPLVQRVTWAQPSDDEATITFELERPVFGWRPRWDGTDLLLDIRRPPVIDPARPLRGRVIAIDPGHPPAGSTGPTGLREAEANLAVSLELRTMLERAGARVVMTRTTDTALGIYERPNRAEAAGAELLVSIHNNAFPDGVNPWANNGTSTYYYQPRAARLARLVQDAMVARMGLRNIGFGRGDLALVRPTWMPTVLTEGAFLMIPEQENALRTPAFQRAYAQGVADGIAAYFAEMGRVR